MCVFYPWQGVFQEELKFCGFFDRMFGFKTKKIEKNKHKFSTNCGVDGTFVLVYRWAFWIASLC